MARGLMRYIQEKRPEFQSMLNVSKAMERMVEEYGYQSKLSVSDFMKFYIKEYDDQYKEKYNEWRQEYLESKGIDPDASFSERFIKEPIKEGFAPYEGVREGLRYRRPKTEQRVRDRARRIQERHSRAERLREAYARRQEGYKNIEMPRTSEFADRLVRLMNQTAYTIDRASNVMYQVSLTSGDFAAVTFEEMQQLRGASPALTPDDLLIKPEGAWQRRKFLKSVEEEFKALSQAKAAQKGQLINDAGETILDVSELDPEQLKTPEGYALEFTRAGIRSYQSGDLEAEWLDGMVDPVNQVYLTDRFAEADFVDKSIKSPLYVRPHKGDLSRAGEKELGTFNALKNLALGREVTEADQLRLGEYVAAYDAQNFESFYQTLDTFAELQEAYLNKERQLSKVELDVLFDKSGEPYDYHKLADMVLSPKGVETVRVYLDTGKQETIPPGDLNALAREVQQFEEIEVDALLPEATPERSKLYVDLLRESLNEGTRTLVNDPDFMYVYERNTYTLEKLNNAMEVLPEQSPVYVGGTFDFNELEASLGRKIEELTRTPISEKLSQELPRIESLKSLDEALERSHLRRQEEVSFAHSEAPQGAEMEDLSDVVVPEDPRDVRETPEMEPPMLDETRWVGGEEVFEHWEDVPPVETPVVENTTTHKEPVKEEPVSLTEKDYKPVNPRITDTGNVIDLVHAKAKKATESVVKKPVKKPTTEPQVSRNEGIVKDVIKTPEKLIKNPIKETKALVEDVIEPVKEVVDDVTKPKVTIPIEQSDGSYEYVSAKELSKDDLEMFVTGDPELIQGLGAEARAYVAEPLPELEDVLKHEKAQEAADSFMLDDLALPEELQFDDFELTEEQRNDLATYEEFLGDMDINNLTPPPERNDVGEREADLEF